MKTVSCRTVFAALAAVHLSVLFAVPGTSALAQMQNRVLVGVPPGGAQNAMAHLFAEKLSEATGRRFVAEAKTGAAGQLAAEALKAAAPDGSTLLMTGHSNISLYPHTTRKPAYNEVIVQALRTQEVQDRLRSFDLEFREMSAQEFGAMVRADSERWAPVIRASGFSASSD